MTLAARGFASNYALRHSGKGNRLSRVDRFHKKELMPMHSRKGSLQEHSATPADHRAGRRFDADWPFIVIGQDREGRMFEERGKLRDIGPSSAFAYITNCPAKGTSLRIRIKTPLSGENCPEFSATTIRIEKSQRGFGVAFRLMPQVRETVGTQPPDKIISTDQ